MTIRDDEIQQLKASVSCAALLEQLPPVWRLDVRESTRHNPKYRRGDGEIVIINHDGRGWWDPLGNAKGDVLTLVQHLLPGLDFVSACRLLREFAGMSPQSPEPSRNRQKEPLAVPVAARWARRPPLSCGSPAWTYLAGERRLPASILLAAIEADAIREGPHASAWFAHRDEAGQVTGFEMRGPEWRGFSTGGGKTLFRLAAGSRSLPRLAVSEGAIDALSLAAIEGLRDDTLYAATAGGLGPGNIATLRQRLETLSADPAAMLVAATDADAAGCRHAARLCELAAAAGVRFERLLPPSGLNDWNDQLQAANPK